MPSIWERLPDEAQRALLVIVLICGSAATAGCNRPIICDPAPPPTFSPKPSGSPTPMICAPTPAPQRTTIPTVKPNPTLADWAPTALTVTPKTTASPIICDPPPRPAKTPTPGAATQTTQSFGLVNLSKESVSTVQQAEIHGKVVDTKKDPIEGITVTVKGGTVNIKTQTKADGTFLFRDIKAGTYMLTVGNQDNGTTLTLKAHDVATGEWAVDGAVSTVPLPLAEIRTIVIKWEEDLTFTHDSPWPEANCRWTVSGGELKSDGDRVTWIPDSQPGVYLLQVIADWGSSGIAVDALALRVESNGHVVIG